DLVDAVQPIGRRDDLRSVLAIEVVARVVRAFPPRVVDGLLAGVERRRERYDGAHVEIAIRPAIESLADAGRKRVVDGRMTQRARDADAHERVLAVCATDCPLQADDR